MASQDLVNEILQLRSRRLSDDEIVTKLLYEGHTNAEVFEALSEAGVTPAFEESNQGEKMEYQEQNQIQYQDYSQPQTFIPPQQNQGMTITTVDTSKISEIAESIIEEKWSDLIEHVNKIIEWKSSVEMKLVSIEENVKSLKSEFDVLHKSILGKINDTDAVMRDVGTDLKALEQVFKKILPGFVENVNELSRITQTMKKK